MHRRRAFARRPHPGTARPGRPGMLRPRRKDLTMSYPNPPQPGYPPPPPPRGTNVMAILSLVFAFVFAPAGIVLGHLAKRQIQQTGEDGAPLAQWGLILSYVFTGLALLACCGGFAAILWGAGQGATS
ncbi:DUF4190 domain-containing protein [Solwaraspora sp. WMMB335]|uniref:DUF4190 domain-containing protein n=1 Tax=Solwaraspora sp. WMMB335 TaxID=3404118 RepID=UPI003B9659C7